MTEQVNAPGLKIINGIEVGYVQPLDFLTEPYLGVKGFGFTGNLTIIDQKTTGNAPSIATGVAPFSYNVSAYYDSDQTGISGRLSYVFSDTSYASGSNQQSVCLPAGTSSGGCPGGAYLFSKAYGQADFSSSFHLNKIFGQDVPSDPELHLRRAEHLQREAGVLFPAARCDPQLLHQGPDLHDRYSRNLLIRNEMPPPLPHEAAAGF